MSNFQVNDRVIVTPLNLSGVVYRIRLDDRNEPIFTVWLDNPAETPDGLYYARRCELLPRPESEAK